VYTRYHQEYTIMTHDHTVDVLMLQIEQTFLMLWRDSYKRIASFRKSCEHLHTHTCTLTLAHT